MNLADSFAQGLKKLKDIKYVISVKRDYMLMPRTLPNVL
jgi:hypothetical protein